MNMEERNNDLECDITRIHQLLYRNPPSETSASDDDGEASVDSDADLDGQDDIATDWSSLGRQGESLDEYFDAEPSLENCLNINRKYQLVLEDTIHELELELIRNRELQCVLRDNLVKSMNNKHSRHIFCTPYFKDRSGHTPPANEDTKRKAAGFELSVVKPPYAWSPKEEEKLIEAITLNANEVILNPKVAKCEVLLAEIDAIEEEDVKGRDIKKRELEKAERELENLRNSSKEIIVSHDFEYDWMKISVLNFDGGRTPMEIKLYWKNYLHPSINKGKWNKEELDKLKNLVRDHFTDGWDEIALQHGFGRTALQCCVKYQVKINSTQRRTWSNEEKEKLIRVIEENRIGDFIPWRRVASFMEGRTLKQLWLQYNYIIDPNIKKGKWTLEEDLWLVAAVWLFGIKNFWKVRRYVPQRTNRQCLDRWNAALNPKLQLGKWTKYEDERLLGLVDKYGKKWATFRDSFSGRTSSMLCRRHMTLTRLQVERVRQNIGLVNQFEYQNRVFRLIYECLNSIAKHKKVKKLKCSSFNELKEIIVSRSRDADDAALRQSCLQMSAENFRRLISPSVTQGKAMKSYSVEQDLITYLAIFHAVGSRGRPFTMFRIDEASEDYEKHSTGLLSILKHQTTENHTQNNIVLFPPMVKSMSAFRSLLLLKNRLVYMKRRADHSNEERQDIELITRSDSYRQMFGQFVALFFWPAVISALKSEILTDIDDEVREENSSGETRVRLKGGKRKKSKKPKSKKPESGVKERPKPSPRVKRCKLELDSSQIRRSSRISNRAE